MGAIADAGVVMQACNTGCKILLGDFCNVITANTEVMANGVALYYYRTTIKNNNLQTGIQELAQAFSGGNFAFAYTHLAEDVQWNIVGSRLLVGKIEVISFCEQTAAYFTGVTTEFTMKSLLVAEQGVAIDGTAIFTTKENKKNYISACDIYRFEKGQIKEITSYCITHKQPDFNH